MTLVEALESILTEEDYTIYMVQRIRRTKLGSALAVIAKFFWIPVLTSPPGQWYLVAFRSHGMLARIQVGHPPMAEAIPVPGWQPSWKDSFDSVVIDDEEYHAVRRMKL